MRLLSTQNLQFFEFYGNDIPQYAILSHRWESDEISYQDMRDSKKHENKQGFRKIDQFRQLALRDGYEYVWVDTCCIDKSSSAELQEAINSMYQWYRKSGDCYAYLSDVPPPNHNIDGRGKSCGAPFLESFKASLWFTRGWTLQELIAPENVIFVDANWKKFGTARGLKKSINEVTEISDENLIGETNLETLRVGRVMAWAAKRRTTRVEDRAYSLLGLFEIDLPMLYGQGERAFQRLQEEILKINDDASILAWSYIDTDTDFTSNGLATSPANFQKYPSLVHPMKKQIHSFVNLTSTLTPQGLQTTLRIRRDPIDDAIGYAVLVDREGQRFRHRISLVIPLMFPRTASSRFTAENECVRFSDPVWVSSNFVEKAAPELVCFIRKVKALDINFKRDGFSLGSRVWESYTTTFTYPIQTQTGFRHFPAVLGGLSRKVKCNQREYTFIIELMARNQASARFVVLIDYQLHKHRPLSISTVTVISIKRPLYLANAVRIAEIRSARNEYTQWDLLDDYGKAIPTEDIVQVNEFNSYWIHAEDNGSDKPQPRPAGEILTLRIDTIIASDR